MDSHVTSAELQATCSALGYSDDDKYYKEPDCLVALKELIRYLKYDDDNYNVRRELGEMKIMQTDLLPLLKTYWTDAELFDVVLRLMVNLTNPALLLFKGIPPKNRDARNIYLQIISQLQDYKEAFVDEKIFAILTNKLGQLLQLDWEHRQEEDTLIIERILILVRNILNVPANPNAEKRTDNDASVHDQVLWALHLSGMEDLLLYISSSDEESNLCLHLIEIISLAFREQSAVDLATAGTNRSTTEKEKDNDDLKMLRQKECFEKQSKMQKFSNLRHSRFGGSFTIKNVKSISDRELVSHSPLPQAMSLTFDRNKSITRRPRHRQLANEIDTTRRSTLSIRLFLKEFCIEFLTSSYNPLMNKVKDNLIRNGGDEHDETYYVWAMKFFMEFNRNYKFRVDLISETMSLPTFHFLQTEIDKNIEMIKVLKENIPLWSRRLHLAVKAYNELLETLSAMDSSSDKQIRESSRILKGNLFYLTEYRELPLVLLLNFNEIITPKSYLKDLIEMTHTFVHLLQRFSRESSHLVIQHKKNASKRKKKPKRPVDNNNIDLDSIWDSLSSDLSSVIQGHIPLPEDVQPFDAALETPLDEQRLSSMSRIQFVLRNSQPDVAVALLRACREVWPEDDGFGSSDISPEDELLALREIFYAPLPDFVELTGPREIDARDEDEDEDEDEIVVRTKEEEFDFKFFVKRFACGKVLRPYALLLRQYPINSKRTNHCIVKMLHRISYDSNEFPLLFQASIFRIFQRIFNEEPDGIYQELIKFAKFVMNKFVEIASKNNKILVELLFWKNIPEAQELQFGYGSHHKTSKILWTEEQEDELRRLFEKAQDQDGDVVDFILDHLIDDAKTRRQVIAQLKRQGLVTNVKDLKPKKKTTKEINIRRIWTEDEEKELRDLFLENKDNGDVAGVVSELMTNKRSKKEIEEKLVQMELISRPPSKKKKANTKRKEKQKVAQPSPSTCSSADGVLHFESSQSNFQFSVRPLTPKLKLSIEWLMDALTEVADDRDYDDPEPVPLVPLSEETREAIDNDGEFTQMLKFLDVKPPNSEQESFWRIPIHLTSSMIRTRVTFLEKLLPTDVVHHHSNEQDLGILETEDNGGSLNEITNEVSSDGGEKVINLTSEDEMEKSKPFGSKRQIDSGDDSDEEVIGSTQKSKRIRVIAESDDDD